MRSRLSAMRVRRGRRAVAGMVFLCNELDVTVWHDMVRNYLIKMEPTPPMHNILFSTAYAADAGTNGGVFSSAAFVQYAPFVLICVVFYFFLIRPQQKRQRELREEQNSLRRGDRIVTAGGIVGTVQNTRDDSQEVDVEIAQGVKVKVIRSTITTILRREGKPANEA